MLKEKHNEILALDTSVLIEYLDKSSPYSNIVERIFSRALRNEISLHTTSLVISELLYVSSRFYKEMDIPQPNEYAYKYILWLKNYIGLKIHNIDYKLSLKIGKFKKVLKIALTDCSVIALAQVINGISLFRKVEREMEPILNILRELNVKFLDEIL